ncbi:Crp/Fnr family transcriptional regulator [Streptomyces sp. NPDC002172]
MFGDSEAQKATPPDPLASLAETGTSVRFQAGEVILREGEPSTHAVLLREGHAKVVTHSADGTEVILGLRGSPNIVGELAALDDRPRSATVVAMTEVRAVVVTAIQLGEFLATHPTAAASVLHTVTARLRESDQRRQELTTQPVAQRVVARLIELTEEIGVPGDTAGTVRLDLSQQELASWAGASREAVVQVLNRLRQQGAVSTARRQIIIEDVDGLKAMATE